MGIFDKLKTQKKEEASAPKKASQSSAEPKAVQKQEAKAEKTVVKPSAKKADVKGKTAQAYRVLVKPLITEKAADLSAHNKYVFAVNPKMNKVEVKKAIRSIYEVDPVAVNILNFSGKHVRYGRLTGQRRAWKKAVVTLKQGDTIQVYEGV
jgi:large subunit ribosomal protein L23